MALERGGGVSLWKQIAERLAAEITESGETAGRRLPTESELAERFGVNRHTLRRALGALAEQGLVRVEQGRGTFVEPPVLDYTIGRRPRFSAAIRGQNRQPSIEVLGAGVMPAEAPVAALLDLRPGAPVVVIETVGRSDGRPVTLGAHHFSAERFPGIGEVYRETLSVTAALARFGVADYVRVRTAVSARPARSAELRLLELPRGRPVLVTESLNVDTANRPVEHGITRFAADRVNLVFEP